MQKQKKLTEEGKEQIAQKTSCMQCEECRNVKKRIPLRRTEQAEKILVKRKVRGKTKRYSINYDKINASVKGEQTNNV